jgi:prepilin-type N-terminal cleavage/methylation domain-containing protein
VQRPRGFAGFTILELMIAVAVIAILATVVLPHWMRDSRKAKARSEVNAMFSELSTKEEQYALDNAGYLSTAACPSAPAQGGQDATGCVTSSGAWVPLRVQLPETSLYCSYEITAGDATMTPAPPAPFAMTGSVPQSWFYIVATCDMDGDSTVNSRSFRSSYSASLTSDLEGS